MIGTTDRMQVDYAQYYLYGSNYVEGEDHDAFQRIWTGNSVAAAAPDYLAVSCGTLAGYIRLTVEGRMDPPGPPGADWETVVDLSLYSLTGELGVQPWGGEAADDAVRRNLAVAGAGWYRVRVETRGRDKGHALNVADPWVEEHRLTLWPAPPTPDHVYRVTDEVGKATYDPTRPADPPIHPPAPSADEPLLRAWARSEGIAIDDNKPIPQSVRALAMAAGVLPTHHEP
ncbi:hypothetical protein [Kitasatospora herbaricolor]|uniref:Uncharacterized protein n=1 Tax=Kitasatospora herbaricolor TaxID=68217 RepID=A0ABZ1WK12_9ACTN|nr:hypothetical protein [Kitasatospora herbaricolor]